jgi:hypothetical protein
MTNQIETNEIMNVTIPIGTTTDENKMTVRYADGMHDMLLELKDGSMKPLQLLLDKASESKAYFIQFIGSLELSSLKPWIISWVDEHFTDNMAKVFFDHYWNGDLYNDATAHNMPTILDDMDACIQMS